MMDFYERKENLTLLKTNCNTKLSKMRLNRNIRVVYSSSSLLFRMLLHVDFCSPREWKPDEENDNNEDDIWFDSLEDEEELNDDEFLDSRD
eukprot:8171345-Ditylum_brightwellii.AAC.1